MTNAEIAEAIRSELFLADVVDGSDIRVSVTGGVAELTGRVEHLLAKRRAGQLARAVRDVRSLTNQLRVEPARRSDDQVRRDVAAALMQNPTVEARKLEVSVQQQTVTLKGSVQSGAERALAEWLSAGVRGVKHINNEIQVVYTPARADEQIERDVEARLRWDVLVHEPLVDVEVEAGQVQLSGTVGSLAEKQRAEDQAFMVPGVVGVAGDTIEIDWSKQREHLRTVKQPVLADDAIKNALNSALMLDPRVDSADVELTVSRGKVVLEGEATTLLEKRVAEQLARDTLGVTKVENRLEVAAGAAHLNPGLRHRVELAFKRSPVVEHYEIAVHATSGNVALGGTVHSYAEKSAAEEVANAVPGVLAVDNNLRVVTPKPFARGPYLYPDNPDTGERQRYAPTRPLQPDPDIRDDIVDQLTWSPFVDASNVKVTVKDGVATLTGSVLTRPAYEAATQNAFEGGAIQVKNHLKYN